MHKMQALAFPKFSCMIVFYIKNHCGFVFFLAWFVCLVWFFSPVLPSEVFGGFCGNGIIWNFGPDSGKYCECIKSVSCKLTCKGEHVTCC